MSKWDMPSIDRTKGMAEPSTITYQLAWMAHWKVAKMSPPSKSDFFTPNHEAREVGSDSPGGLEVTSSLLDVPTMDNRFCKVPANNTVNIMDMVTNTVDIVDGKTVAIASRYLTEEGPISAPSLALAPPQPSDASITLGNQRASGLSYDEAWTPLAMPSYPRDRIEGSADDSKKPFESENFVGKKSIVFSTHCQESTLGSSSGQVPRSLDAEGNSLTLSTGNLDLHVSMTTPSLWNRATSLLQHDYAPTGQKRLLTYPAETDPLEATKCKTFCSEHSFRPSHSVVDMMTTRTHTFDDSTERLAAGQMKFIQTMHQSFFSEKTDPRIPKRSRIFRESTVYANYQGNSTFGQFLSLSMDGNRSGNPGVKLQPLWSSTDGEGHENLADIKTSTISIKNDSSAETNTLDMGAMAGKHLSGEMSSSPKKDAWAGKGNGGLANVGLCEKKRKLLTLVTMSSSMEDGEPSPSKIQSFKVEHLLPHDDQGSHSNPEAHTHCSGCHEPEQGDGWMKQSKASDSDLRERLKLGDACPAQKLNDLFSSISKKMKCIFPPVTADTLGKQITGSGECAPSSKDGVSTSGDKTMGGKGRGALLSDPWIRRWCHHKTAAVLLRKREPVVLHEPLSAKAFEELQWKQLPSVASMALTGKAMKGFHPCEFTRRGSVVVWNS